MKDSIITLHDFGVAYEKKTVLEGVNTTIRRGRITAIIGPSGCGKSTMLKAMNRMLELQGDAQIRGSIHLNGQLWEQNTTQKLFTNPQRQETKDYLQGAYA